MKMCIIILETTRILSGDDAISNAQAAQQALLASNKTFYDFISKKEKGPKGEPGSKGIKGEYGQRADKGLKGTQGDRGNCFSKPSCVL